MRRALLLQRDPRRHHVPNRLRNPRVANHFSRPNLLKNSLAEVIRQPRHVIHMSMTHRNVRRCQRNPRAQPNVKTNIQFRNLNARLLTSNADPLHPVGRHIQESHLPLLRGLFWQHHKTPSVPLSQAPGQNRKQIVAQLLKAVKPPHHPGALTSVSMPTSPPQTQWHGRLCPCSQPCRSHQKRSKKQTPNPFPRLPRVPW